MNPDVLPSAADPDFEDEVARQIMKSRSPAWLNLVLVAACLALLGTLSLAYWMTAHPEQWASLLDSCGVEHPRPFFIAVLLCEVSLAVFIAHRRLADTETTLNWWIRIYWRRWSSRPGRLTGRTKRILLTVIFCGVSLVQKIKAASLVVCLVIIAAAGVAIYMVTHCDPWTYLTVQMENGLPVRGTWQLSEATAGTLAKEDPPRVRAEGPFKRSDPDAARRAQINNAWDAEGFDQTQYPYPAGPLAASPKARVTLEIKSLNPSASPQSVHGDLQQTTVAGGDNWRFVQLPSWTLTNSATMASEEFTRLRSELGGMSLAQCVGEAQVAGGLYVSSAPASLFSVREEASAAPSSISQLPSLSSP